jgi:hypothetical protein
MATGCDVLKRIINGFKIVICLVDFKCAGGWREWCDGRSGDTDRRERERERQL